MGIYSDLFPGVEIPQPDRAELLKCINKELEKRNLQPTDWYLEKIIQVDVLYLTMLHVYSERFATNIMEAQFKFLRKNRLRWYLLSLDLFVGILCILTLYSRRFRIEIVFLRVLSLRLFIPSDLWNDVSEARFHGSGSAHGWQDAGVSDISGLPQSSPTHEATATTQGIRSNISHYKSESDHYGTVVWMLRPCFAWMVITDFGKCDPFCTRTKKDYDKR